MLDIKRLKTYCGDDYTKIDGYDEAIKSDELYVCHHLAEILPCGSFKKDDLIKFGLYWKRPHSELILIKKSVHSAMHCKITMTGKIVSDETRLKQSLKHKGKKLGKWSDEHRKHLLGKVAGSKNGMYGKPSPRRKKVMQFTLDGEFIREWQSIKEAAHNTKASSGNIVSCCKGAIKSSGGFIWKYCT